MGDDMGTGAWSEDAKSKRAEGHMSVSEVRNRFIIDIHKGTIFNRETGMRLDKIHYFREQTPILGSRRYRQVSCRSKKKRGRRSRSAPTAWYGLSRTAAGRILTR
jgi:hypothetical protein